MQITKHYINISDKLIGRVMDNLDLGADTRYLHGSDLGKFTDVMDRVSWTSFLDNQLLLTRRCLSMIFLRELRLGEELSVVIGRVHRDSTSPRAEAEQR